ncbi:protein seele-like [Daktulosphaira vitifoliae]|uniref:protein seele-like n=1 Tax=Daktulosphaira vitifoliae TaxID=58002 RepID=UPI0021A99129|nr:protein seele-like [Daktulosphaira vitifoliae]
MFKLNILLFIYVVPSFAVSTSELKCEVCCRLVELIQKNVSSVDPSRVVQVLNFRLDENGNNPSNIVPLSRSQIYLSEVMDSVCKQMSDYVRATFKENGTLTVMPLVLDGKMNPLMSEVDVIQDSDLNKSLEYYCDDIVDDIADDIYKIMKSENNKNVVDAICTDTVNLCPIKKNRVEL